MRISRYQSGRQAAAVILAVFLTFMALVSITLTWAQTPPIPGASVKLGWDANPPADEVTSYQLYHSANVSGPWTLIGVTSSNVLEFTVDSSNTNFPGGFAPGVHAFYVTASNFWGESFPSDTVASPPIASGVTSLTISRNP